MKKIIGNTKKFNNFVFRLSVIVLKAINHYTQKTKFQYFMRTVYTKEELAATLSAGETALVKGNLAKTMQKNANLRKGLKWAGMGLIAASLCAAPFTGGTSLMGIGAGAVLTISATELAILVGGAIAIYGIYKNCRVTFNKDGSATVEPK